MTGPSGLSDMYPREPRRSAYARGYTKRWAQYSRLRLRRNPLCVECQRHGRTTAATVTDHVIPHRGDMVLFWAERNMASLCKLHHDQKTAKGE